MNKIKTLFFLTLLCLSFNSIFAQKNYFFGRSFYVDLNYNYSPSIFANRNSIKTYDIQKDGSYKIIPFESKCRTFGLSLNKTFKELGGMGIELSYTKQNAITSSTTDYYYGSNYYGEYYATGMTQLSSLGALLVYRLQEIGINRPMGFSQDIGLGFNRYKVLDPVHLAIVDTNAYYYYDPYTVNEFTTYYSNGQTLIPVGTKFNEVRIVYGMTIRKAISKQLALKFGYRFSGNFVLRGGDNLSNSTLNNLIDIKQEERLKTFFELNAGLTFMLK